jgi:hypothetical protein
LSRFGTNTGNKKNPLDESMTRTNREVFVHYSIPLFTFKTRKLPPGKYEFPFQFTLSSQVLASFQYNDNGFHLAIHYSMTASLEEDKEQNEDEDLVMGHIRDRRELRIVKNKKVAPSTFTMEPNHIEVNETLKIPTCLCFK